jgi:hypothetical protein
MSMRHLLGRVPNGPRLHLFAALVAALLLVPAASAFAGVPGKITGAGEGSGWVKGRAAPEEQGNPPVRCHWNGVLQEFDYGTSESTKQNEVPGLNECTFEAIDTGTGEGAVQLEAEHDPGSLLYGWDVEEGVFLASCGEPVGTQEETCGVLQFSPPPAGIKVKVTFNCEITSPCPPPSTGPSLKVLKGGNGEGTVTSEPPGIDCGSTCEAGFEENEVVKLEAEALTGSEFTGWSEVSGDPGTCTGTASPCEMTLSEAKEIEASFVLETRELTVNESGPGSVAVECEEGSGFEACAKPLTELDYGTEVKLTATPNAGAKVESLSGTASAAACSAAGVEPEEAAGCAFAITEDSEVTATFAEINLDVHIVIEGAGAGTVEGASGAEGGVPHVECSYASPGPQTGTCDTEAQEDPLFEALTIDVQAHPAHGSAFAGWTLEETAPGGVFPTESCEEPSQEACGLFLLEGEVTIKATFVPTYPLTVEVEGPGSVTAPEDINCPEVSCSGTYNEGNTVTLTETPAEHAHFVEWTGSDAGACAGESTPTCEVEMSEAKTVKAVFAYNTHNLEVELTGSGEINGGPISGCEEGGAGTCSGSVNEGEMIKLTGTAAHHEFAWSGVTCAVETAIECEFEMPAADTKVAVSSAPITHTLEVELTGPGEVNAAPGPIAGCEEGGAGTCSGTYDEGGTVTLTGVEAHYEFAFSGVTCTRETATECEFEMPAADTKVEASSTQITHTLGITLAGTGSGSVECKVGTGSFGACASSYDEGTQLTLKDVPAAHSEFSGWSAGTGSISCTGTGECGPFNLEADSTVTATNTQKTHTLGIALAGTGSGSVECKVGTGSFGACASSYDEGTQLTLKDVPAAHSEFSGWSAGTGSISCTGTGECGPFNLEADSTVTATNTQITHTLAVTVSGPGSVSADSGAISGCEEAGGTCSGSYDEGSTVVLTATPGAHQEIAWSGCDSHTATTCTVTVNADAAVTETETMITHTLTVATAGTGSGSVSCDAGACASSYPEGTTVTLTATAASGSSFTGWSGGCSGTGDCVVALNADTTVTATFTKEEASPPPTCETDPSLCPPPAAGTAKATGTAQVKGNKALLKLKCTGGGACQGLAKLFAKLPSSGKKKHKRANSSTARHRKKAKLVLIGKARFSLASGASKTIKVKITNGQVKKLLKQGKAVKATLKGAGIKSRTIKLKPKGKKKHKRHRVRGGGH